ncbi:hypothetical protein [Celeribacter naphthalenivorans]|uniref:hypothetical protein n=1 Tax=Celeribacter naphthalenivorans TaxID=1614694 RepID=UPI001CFBED31|nr:hypothetical protein [Celeribacter naphthalenivorans]
MQKMTQTPRGFEPMVEGMTLRDWFAGQCMRDTFASLAASGQANLNEFQLERCARMSYVAADAMLKARGE